VDNTDKLIEEYGPVSFAAMFVVIVIIAMATHF